MKTLPPTIKTSINPILLGFRDISVSRLSNGWPQFGQDAALPETSFSHAGHLTSGKTTLVLGFSHTTLAHIPTDAAR
jgi:hypothetical protein